MPKLRNPISITTGLTALATVVGMVTVVALISNMPDLELSSSNKLCLPCANNKGKLCCASSALILHGYLEQKVEESYDQLNTAYEKEKDNDYLVDMKDHVRRHQYSIKPSARFSGARQQPLMPHDKGPLYPVRAWRLSYGDFNRYGIKLRNGRIVVPVSGTYKVYCCLSLREPCNLSNGVANSQPKDAIQHSVFRYNILREEEQELVTITTPRHLSANRYFNTYSSYMSTDLHLEAGDELTVKVTNTSYLDAAYFNYFGVTFL